MAEAEFPGLECEVAGQETVFAPELSAPDVAGVPPYRAPENARQEILCDIFAEILEVPRIGIDDDFFALGGQSIHGVFIATRANAAFGCQMSLIDLFDASTVAELDQLLTP